MKASSDLSPRAALRGVALRSALCDKPRLVTVCGWCHDSAEQTAAARAHGFDVSHGLCKSCEATLYAELEAIV